MTIGHLLRVRLISYLDIYTVLWLQVYRTRSTSRSPTSNRILLLQTNLLQNRFSKSVGRPYFNFIFSKFFAFISSKNDLQLRSLKSFFSCKRFSMFEKVVFPSKKVYCIQNSCIQNSFFFLRSMLQLSNRLHILQSFLRRI